MGMAFEGCEGMRMAEWEKQQQQEQQQQQQQQQIEDQNPKGGVGGDLYVKVMTDEQLEVLRRQISVYATICESLVEMHKSITAQQDFAGMKFGNLYCCDPLMASAPHKITARQRWTPTPKQLQILEHIFEQGIGTPSKQKIKEIATELLQHGQISETNVYNWFQNRRARSKRKQSVAAPNSTESEVETDAESPKDKKTKPENTQSQENSAAARDENMYFPNPEMGSEMHCLDTEPKGIFPPDHGLRSSSNLAPLSFYDNSSNPRLDQLMGKMEVAGGFSPYRLGDEYDMVG